MPPEPDRVLAPGYGAWVYPMLFNTRIVVGPIGSVQVDEAWCFHADEMARKALAAWNFPDEPAPTGWHKNPMTGERRDVPDPRKA